jgi:hypothetical protein
MSWPEEHTFKYRMCLFASILHGTHCSRQRSRLLLRRYRFRSSAHSMGPQTCGVLFISLKQRPCPHNNWVPRRSPRPRDPLDALHESRRGWHRSRYASVTFSGACLHLALRTDDLMSDMIYHPRERTPWAIDIASDTDAPSQEHALSLHRSQQGVPKVHRTSPGRHEGLGPSPRRSLPSHAPRRRTDERVIGWTEHPEAHVHPDAPR